MGVSPYSERSYHFRLTGLQNLIYFGKLAGLRKQETLSRLSPLRQEFTVTPLLERHFSEFSLGLALISVANILLISVSARSTNYSTPSAKAVITSSALLDSIASAIV